MLTPPLSGFPYRGPVLWNTTTPGPGMQTDNDPSQDPARTCTLTPKTSSDDQVANTVPEELTAIDGFQSNDVPDAEKSADVAVGWAVQPASGSGHTTILYKRVCVNGPMPTVCTFQSTVCWPRPGSPYCVLLLRKRPSAVSMR